MTSIFGTSPARILKAVSLKNGSRLTWVIQADRVYVCIVGVSLEKIAGFKKMQWYTKDYNTVVEALKEQPSDLIEIDEEGKRVRRKTKVVEKKSVPCSIYAVCSTGRKEEKKGTLLR